MGNTSGTAASGDDNKEKVPALMGGDKKCAADKADAIDKAGKALIEMLGGKDDAQTPAGRMMAQHFGDMTAEDAKKLHEEKDAKKKEEGLNAAMKSAGLSDDDAKKNLSLA